MRNPDLSQVRDRLDVLIESFLGLCPDDILEVPRYLLEHGEEAECLFELVSGAESLHIVMHRNQRDEILSLSDAMQIREDIAEALPYLDGCAAA